MKKTKRKMATIIFSCLIAIFVFNAKPANAGIPVSVLASVPSVMEHVWDEFLRIVKEAFLNMAAVGYKNSVEMFVTKMAEDTAKWIASGGEGQSPLFYTENWGEYMKQAGEDAIAEGVISIADKVGMGDICASPQVSIDILLPQLEEGDFFGDVSRSRRKKPRCTLDDMKKNWNVQDPNFLKNFTLSYRQDQNDLGIAVSFISELANKKAKEEEAQKKERQDSQFKSVKSIVSEIVQSPSVAVEESFKALRRETGVGLFEYTGRPVADAINVFTKTLASQYLTKLQTGFFSLADIAGVSSSDDLRKLARNSLLDPDSVGPTGEVVADIAFSNIYKPDLKSVDNFDLLSEFRTCPTEVKYSSVHNCVIDEDFAQALYASGSEGYYTVQRAIDDNLLHGDWPFGYTDPVSGTEPSHENGYPYSSMKKLRQARIIPVGWEFAALRARQIGTRVTLQDVVFGFDDENSLFYNLVDPDWVLKIPQLQCTAKVPGQVLLNGTENRVSTCVDIQNCIATNPDGSCASYGYCTHEKRTWVMPGESCEEEFATCQQFFERDKNESDNFWLNNTLERAGCNAQNAGCTWFSLARDDEGNWQEDQRIYLNYEAKQCEAENAGCNLYYKTKGGTNVLQNSSFEDDAGHDYVLGNGDKLAGNNIPDGWALNNITTLLQDNVAVDGEYFVRLSPSAGGDCDSGLTYTAPLGMFEVGQRYVLSGRVKTDSLMGESVRLIFQGIPFTVEDVIDVWQPFSFTFNMPAASGSHLLILGLAYDRDQITGACNSISTSVNVDYDAVQLEKGTQATPYKDYGSSNQVYLNDAAVCSYEEVGCLKFKPVNKQIADEVTAVATGADLCPAECVGYNTYEQQKTELETDNQLVNFIADTANKCNAQSVGCTEFTNLDEVARGGEGKEYYVKLKHCEKPQSQCKTYFSWEGNDVTGFQLTSYSLFAENVGLEGGEGGPATIDGSGCDTAVDGDCSCDGSDSGCRELIDEDGNEYVRSLDKTISCSEQCVPLRAPENYVDQTTCEARHGQWEVATGRCVYQAIAEESVTCSAAANGCREYIGNTGHNVAVVFADDFEDADVIGWSQGSPSTESTSVGGHSIKLSGSTFLIDESTVYEGISVGGDKSYLLEFQVKSSVSDPVEISASLGNYDLGSVEINTVNWGAYKLGPVALPIGTTVVDLQISVNGSTTRNTQMDIYLDNILVRQLKDSVYLVKDSWETPLTCDTNPPLQGGTSSRSMVGCQAYTVEGEPNAGRVYLKSFTRLCSEDKVGCEALIDTQNSSVPYSQIFQEGDLAEVVVPQDKTVYLVNNKENECEQDNKGCMIVGEPQFDIDDQVQSYVDTYIINDPDTYNQTLCMNADLQCKEYETSAGEVIYAKDPLLKQCEYRLVPESLPVRYAWFVRGENDENPQECEDARENQYVKRCGEEQVSCTQFYEPITKDSIFYKKNTLQFGSGDCNGIVDWKKGCVLFNDLSLDALKFKSSIHEDYEGSLEDYVGAPEGCVNGVVGCDTNVLQKVLLDRECSQWITSVSSSRFWDPVLGEFRTTSYSPGRCLEYDPVDKSVCRVWDNSENKDLLTINEYMLRDTGWASQDWTGMSIPNLYPVETLRQRSISKDADGNPVNFRLTKLANLACVSNSDCPSSQICEFEAGDLTGICTSECVDTTDCPDGQVCRLSLDPDLIDFRGRCYVEDGVDSSGVSLPAVCRGYPEDDSPFPESIVQEWFSPTDDDNPDGVISVIPQFVNANVAVKGQDVECNYQKVDYNGEIRFYNVESLPPSSVVVDGEVNEFKQRDMFIGWEGYCLEKDPSRLINGSEDQAACMTWYPVDMIQGAFDFNNSRLKSGYKAASDRQYYCVEAIPAEYRREMRVCDHDHIPPGYYGEKDGDCHGGENHIYLVRPYGGEGWYPFDGTLNESDRGESIQEVFGIMCTKVALIQSPSGYNKAWTNRLVSEDNPISLEYFVDDLRWGRIQQNEPYGAADVNVMRLEELGQSLVIKDSNLFVDDCEECETDLSEEDDVTEEITADEIRLYGICKDDEPQKKGKFCVNSPNAGSPYALDASILDESDRMEILNEYVTIRANNEPADQAPLPYSGNDTYYDGFRRLQQLFAKSYGVWEWRDEPNYCVGECVGGLYEGSYCTSDSACGKDEDDSNEYVCKAGTCDGGKNNLQDCSGDVDCQFEPTGRIHQCVDVGSKFSRSPIGVCESGLMVGESCLTYEDCSDDAANGVCDFQKKCIPSDIVNFEPSVINGEPCSDSGQCNLIGNCRTTRCANELPGLASNGSCDNKDAGDICYEVDELQTNRQYVRLGLSEPAYGWDIIKDSPELAEKPVIRPVVVDLFSPTGFNEGGTPGVTVNGTDVGNIVATDGRAPVSVSFYAYNDSGNQMPLRIIMVDWGDGTDPAESRGFFKNHKHVCRSYCSNDSGIECTFDEECQDSSNPDAVCMPFNFGDSEDACIADTDVSTGFFSFSYTYTCSLEDALANDSDNILDTGSVCVFKPTVLVRDNWGATTKVRFNGNIIVEPRIES